jgi:proteasome lid subunit RPN8/RPN11
MDNLAITVDIEAAKNTIRTHAAHCYPYEACGLIHTRGNKQDVLCGRNVASDPRHTFILHPEDFGAAEDAGEILAVYHSHCDESPEPSMADKTLAERNGVPVLIVSWPADQWAIYKPTGWKPDLVGRPFVYGVLDCLTLIQDYFKERHGIVIPNFRYDDQWWKRGTDLYGENLPKGGFQRVDELEADDLILMALDSKIANHSAIYVGDGLMLHHPPGHLSGVHPYICDRGYYALCTTGYWRHGLLIKAALAKALDEINPTYQGTAASGATPA